MNQPQQDIQQPQQITLPMGSPIINNINLIYQQKQNELQIFSQKVGSKLLQLQIQNMTNVQIQTSFQLDQNQLYLINDQNVPLKIIYGNQQNIVVNKSHLEYIYCNKIPQNVIDLTQYSQNITQQDFEIFFQFLSVGYIQFMTTKLPTFICLFVIFQLHNVLKEAIFQLMNYLSCGACDLSNTEKYDDLLLYHLVEQDVVSKPSYEPLKSLIYTHQWFFLNSSRCWFSQNGQISPLIMLYNQEQLHSFLDNIYIIERMQYFQQNQQSPQINSDMALIPTVIHQIIQQFYMGKSFQDPHLRTQQVKLMMMELIPLKQQISISLFNLIKDFYDQTVVNDILVSIIESQQQEIENLRVENNALTLISKQSIWHAWSNS